MKKFQNHFTGDLEGVLHKYKCIFERRRDKYLLRSEPSTLARFAKKLLWFSEVTSAILFGTTVGGRSRTRSIGARKDLPSLANSDGLGEGQ